LKEVLNILSTVILPRRENSAIFLIAVGNVGRGLRDRAFLFLVLGGIETLAEPPVLHDAEEGIDVLVVRGNDDERG
jgi:hypothetical protein